MHLGPVGLGAQLRRQVRRWREEQRLEAFVLVEVGRQRPAQPCLTGAAQVFADRALTEAEALGDDVLGQASMAQPQQLAKVTHGQSLGGHLVSLGKGARLTAG